MRFAVTGNRDPGHRVAHALGRQRQQEPAVVGRPPRATAASAMPADDDRAAPSRRGPVARAVDLDRLAGDEVWKHAPAPASSRRPRCGLGHADRRPRAIVTVTAHADTEDQAVTGQVLQRRHVLRDRTHGSRRSGTMSTPQAEPDPVRWSRSRPRRRRGCSPGSALPGPATSWSITQADAKPSVLRVASPRPPRRRRDLAALGDASAGTRRSGGWPSWTRPVTRLQTGCRSPSRSTLSSRPGKRASRSSCRSV